MRVGLALAAVLAWTGLIVAPANAVTHGVLDGNDHPYVGLMVAKDGAGEPQWRCSGTLISPTIFLTAGHCTAGAARVEIWFDADLTDASAHNYPDQGDVAGTPYSHPLYDEAAFSLYDLGVVVLDEEVSMPEYGALPDLNLLDKLATQRGRQDVSFTAVGYGRQRVSRCGVLEESATACMVPTRLNQINTGFTGDGSLVLSNNARTGGTCFGDSGGPNFIGSSNVIAGVTSFGNNDTCAGTGGVYRVDRVDDLEWLNTFND